MLSPSTAALRAGSVLGRDSRPVPCRTFNSIAGFYSLEATSNPLPVLMTKKSLQTLLTVPWGAKSPPVEKHPSTEEKGGGSD